MHTSLDGPRFYRKRATPWPVRIFLVVAILFGIWVDLSDADFGLRTPDGDAASNSPTRPPLLGLSDEHSFAANVVRSLAARH